MKPHTYRHYDPGTGRFLSEDPIDFGGGDFNLYRYVGNMLPNKKDPSGKYSAEQWLLVIVGITAATIAARVIYNEINRRMENETRTEYRPETSYIQNQCGPPTSVTQLIPRNVPDYGAINRNNERRKKLKELSDRINEYNKILNSLNDNQSLNPGFA